MALEDANPENCYLKGTRILTTTGERPIQDLVVGDAIPTRAQGVRPNGIQQVEWIARYVYRRDRTKPWVRDIRPVRIACSALADGVPNRDLYVTSRHAILVDDVLICAESLVNGATITLDPAEDRDVLEYYHVKFAEAEIITANGAPSELLTDVENSVYFADYVRRYGPPVPQQRLPVFYNNRKQILMRHLRSALSPWYDCRHEPEVICYGSRRAPQGWSSHQVQQTGGPRSTGLP